MSAYEAGQAVDVRATFGYAVEGMAHVVLTAAAGTYRRTFTVAVHPDSVRPAAPPEPTEPSAPTSGKSAQTVSHTGPHAFNSECPRCLEDETLRGLFTFWQRHGRLPMQSERPEATWKARLAEAAAAPPASEALVEAVAREIHDAIAAGAKWDTACRIERGEFNRDGWLAGESAETRANVAANWKRHNDETRAQARAAIAAVRAHDSAAQPGNRSAEGAE